MPKNAPVSIMPSSATFTTPLRSENMPPIAPKVSGVAKTSINAIREALKTWSRLLVLDWSAATASPAPSTPAATAPQPTLPAPRETAHQHRPDDAPEREGRDREPAGEHAEHDPGDADGRGLAQARASQPYRVGRRGRHAEVTGRRARLSFRRAFQRYRIRTSAPTKRTTRPWMISVRFPVSWAGISLELSPCVVPYSNAPKRSAARPVPTAVFRPSSATAIPRNPIEEP